MKKQVFSFVFLILFFSFCFVAISFAQERTSRFKKQHDTYFVREHLETTENMLLQQLQDNKTNSKLSAVQTIRQLEEVFPTISFSLFIEPLSNIVKNEDSDTQLRIISAIALDELHSDIGDQAIYDMAKNSTNESVKNVCTAISFEVSKKAALSSK